MPRKGITVHFDRRPGGLGKVPCRDGHLIKVVTDPETKVERIVTDLTSPCPLCNATAAANMAGWKAILTWMTPIFPDGRRLVETPQADVPRVKRSDAEGDALDTSHFHVTKVPEGVVPRRNREGGFVRKGGQVVMDTIDFRSDEAVSRRLAGGMSKWGKGNVTGSTSVCSTWAVPAHPDRDTMANSDVILKDVRAQHKERIREKQRTQNPPPRRGAHQKPQTVVVRRHMA